MSLNPFLWSGPLFLALYGVVVIAVIRWCWGRTRNTDEPLTRLQSDLTKDPYAIAYLRAGKDEALRVAVFNLLDRGLLYYNPGELKTARSDRTEALRRPLDRAIAKACEESRSPASLAGNNDVNRALQAYESDLVKHRLLPDYAEKARRVKVMLIAFAVLAGVAGIKIAVALNSGRDNFGFLVVVATVATVFTAVLCHPRKTALGHQVMASLNTLLGRLQSNSSHIKPGGATNEALLLAAVAGLYALPMGTFAFVEEVYPKPQPASGGGGDGGGDSSSCSSSCGGGGGCGGCGG